MTPRQIITLTVDGNTLTPSSTDAGVQGENEATVLSCTVPADWDGLDVRLTVITQNGAYDISEPPAAGVITLPLRAGVMVPGPLTVSLRGSDGAGVRKTADCRSLRVQWSAEGSHQIAGSDPQAIEVILAKAQAAVDQAGQAEQSAADAQQSRTAAAVSAGQAAGSAEAAAGSAAQAGQSASSAAAIAQQAVSAHNTGPAAHAALFAAKVTADANGQVASGRVADAAITCPKLGADARLSVLTRGANLFNMADPDVVSGSFVNGTTGALGSSAGFYASGWILVSAGAAYVFAGIRHYAFYDSNKGYLSGASFSAPFTSRNVTAPSGAAYLRFSWYQNDVSLGTQQVNAGSALLPYAPYTEFVPAAHMDPSFAPVFADQSIPTVKLAAGRGSTNLFRKDTALSDTALIPSTGASTASTGSVTSDYIQVTPGSPYIILFVRGYAFYDARKNFLSGASPAQRSLCVVTAPANAAYLRFTWYPPSDTTTVFQQQVNAGTVPLLYEDGAAAYIRQTFLEPKKTTLTLPPNIYAVVGAPVNVYFQNIARDDLSQYQAAVTCAVGQQNGANWTATPTAAGTYPLAVAIYQDSVNKVAAAAANVVVKPAAAGAGVTRKCLFIGDSTLNYGYYTQRVLDLCAPDGFKVQLLGTHGTAPNLQEGRAGWSAATYLTNTVYTGDGKANPFYNPATGTFDFSYYMAQQGYSGLDYAVIGLGINDMFSAQTDADAAALISTALTAYDTIVGSIRAYNASIKIGLLVTIPPTANLDIWGSSYGCSQRQWRYKRNNSLWVEQLMAHYSEGSGVYLVPTNVNIDAANNTDTGVHPALAGYNQMGDMIYYWLKGQES